MQFRVQRIKVEQGKHLWLVLEKGLSIEPIESFLSFLFNTEKSPNTLESYAHHLKLYWQFLLLTHKNWQSITIADFSQFVVWLRMSIPITPRRVESTVNTILSAIASFYRHHNRLGNTSIQLTEATYLPINRCKSLLYHVHKNIPIYKRVVSLKAAKHLPKTINEEQMKAVLETCCNDRDRFLLCLLFETGLRISQALSLYHTDIKSFDNEIHVIYRTDHPHRLRNKSHQPNVLAISSTLMRQYAAYLEEYADLLSAHSYVFINLMTGEALNYSAVRKLFARISKQVGFWLTPHMLRHTHATALIKSGWDAAFVQKRLGHVHVGTTINQYVHLEHADLKKAFQYYLSHQAKGNK
jgi:site-specific recombinase XerD